VSLRRLLQGDKEHACTQTEAGGCNHDGSGSGAKRRGSHALRRGWEDCQYTLLNADKRPRRTAPFEISSLVATDGDCKDCCHDLNSPALHKFRFKTISNTIQPTLQHPRPLPLNPHHPPTAPNDINAAHQQAKQHAVPRSAQCGHCCSAAGGDGSSSTKMMSHNTSVTPSLNFNCVLGLFPNFLGSCRVVYCRKSPSHS